MNVFSRRADDFGLLFGLTARLRARFELGARYGHSLSPLFSVEFTSADGEPGPETKFYHTYFQLFVRLTV